MAFNGEDSQPQALVSSGNDMDLMAKIQSFTLSRSCEYVISTGQGDDDEESRFLPFDHIKDILSTDTEDGGYPLDGLTVASWPLFVHWLYAGKLPPHNASHHSVGTLQLYRQLAEFAFRECVPGLLLVVEEAIVKIIDSHIFEVSRMIDFCFARSVASEAIATLLYLQNFEYFPHGADSGPLQESLSKLAQRRVESQNAVNDGSGYDLDKYEKLYPGFCRAILGDILDSWSDGQERKSVEKFQEGLKKASKKRKADQ